MTAELIKDNLLVEACLAALFVRPTSLSPRVMDRFATLFEVRKGMLTQRGFEYELDPPPRDYQI